MARLPFAPAAPLGPAAARPLSVARVGAAALAVATLAACAGRAPRPAPLPEPAPPPVEVDAPATAGAVSAADLAYLRNRALVVPVAGARASRVPPSFFEPRSGGRVHQAVDILAPRGTPVVAADEGRVWKIKSNALGGLTVYATDPLERFVYYYAHLDRYRAGLFEGQPLFRGDTLGFVGTTGNAPRDTPHLHFQISRVARDGQWWGGTPVDPLPFLRAAEVARERGADAAEPALARAGEPAGERLVRPASFLRPTVPADTTAAGDTGAGVPVDAGRASPPPRGRGGR
jgi:murein DD-endopeptidase MepM/ murein hydrolase activator NlpD